jgi:hypothetical protein
MDKKQLTAIVDAIVAEVATTNGLEEGEARTLVGIALRKNKESFVKAVVVPTLGLVAKTETAVTESK